MLSCSDSSGSGLVRQASQRMNPDIQARTLVQTRWVYQSCIYLSCIDLWSASTAVQHYEACLCIGLLSG